MKIHVISDTHFNHQKLVEFEKRPANFNEIIIRNWNKTVADDDLVIHLGDVILGHDSSLDTILTRCKGRKVLARGNHDHKSIDWYMARGFDFVCDYFVYKNLAFSHAPLTPLPLQNNRQKSGTENWEARNVDLNIHGHFHRGTHRGIVGRPDRYYDFEYFDANRPKYHLIQIEDNLRPVMLNEVLAKAGVELNIIS